jgi:hypothetical protein
MVDDYLLLVHVHLRAVVIRQFSSGATKLVNHFNGEKVGRRN